MLENTNHDAEAIEAIKRALNIYPNYAEAHFLLGLIYARQKKAADAVAAFQKAISVYPNFAEARMLSAASALEAALDAAAEIR